MEEEELKRDHSHGAYNVAAQCMTVVRLPARANVRDGGHRGG